MKRAIVLGGGGSRGGYHIGVWKALRELGIDYQMVTGTSVGALNGAIMAQNDFESAVKMWENLTTCDVLDTETDVA
ncbi:MAG: patatin-like phospholipase family protein, partial [Oscillospiraceae bacterium]|nr:patatin-like phospholipase family protein [Oscillospiraceae bacterium]